MSEQPEQSSVMNTDNSHTYNGEAITASELRHTLEQQMTLLGCIGIAIAADGFIALVVLMLLIPESKKSQ